ncbi:hypothetical protein Aeqsu_2160 [Aequorivita sublithincola DSM 14238]|uniref:DUF4870 domain-containing protein n=1 Tax=Aequorivita sublithincola (strain DSM 14238 / LMG 21431 / ACAM 643 / 9-3) TaxID=746697 RepID=I3YXA2_AEQSU|nr:DUF4870 domain-containing protein [Aequorivita sublithincola]AFL81620.1 hypothetical protein Aeqsu_2160 [Aequorivita sublithincola DSM 14238]
METTITENQKNTSAFIHLSTFLKYFFPFANFIAPLLIWTFNKEKSFVDEHGKQAINFQLSVLIYTLLIGLICLPFVLIFATDFISLLDSLDHNSWDFSTNNIQNLSGYILLFGLAMVVLLGLFVFELYAVINASIHASRGLLYKYPLSIPFIKTNLNPIQNEHIS